VLWFHTLELEMGYVTFILNVNTLCCGNNGAEYLKHITGWDQPYCAERKTVLKFRHSDKDLYSLHGGYIWNVNLAQSYLCFQFGSNSHLDGTEWSRVDILASGRLHAFCGFSEAVAWKVSVETTLTKPHVS